LLLVIAILATVAASKISAVCALRQHASAVVVAASKSTSTSTSASAPLRARHNAGIALFGTKQPHSQHPKNTAKASTARKMSSSSTSTGTEGPGPGTTPSTFAIPKNLRGLFAGSGLYAMSQPAMNDNILDLLPPEKKTSDDNNRKNIKILYLGTASYDIEMFRDKQTQCFVDRGCTVSSLDVALRDKDQDAEANKDAIHSADVIIVSGGNTLYAIDRWKHLGLIPHLTAAMERGCILTGGSAGAICWFDAGHSDSADPETYGAPMLEQYGRDDKDTKHNTDDESSEYDAANKKEWQYLRVPGLGFFPGPVVCCPHHDRVQSNGLLRATDFDAMLLAKAKASSKSNHPKSVLGIGIDHFAALIVEGERYKVYQLPDKEGSVLNVDGTDAPVFAVAEDGTATGVPGVWIKRVLRRRVLLNGKNNNNKSDDDNDNDDDLVLEAMVAPPEGNIAELLAYGGDNLDFGSSSLNEKDDEEENQKAIDKCRRENPSGIQL